MTPPADRTGLPDARRYAVPARLAAVGLVLARADLAASKQKRRPGGPLSRSPWGLRATVQLYGGDRRGAPAPRRGPPVAATSTWDTPPRPCAAWQLWPLGTASQMRRAGRPGAPARSRPAADWGVSFPGSVSFRAGRAAGLGVDARARLGQPSALDRVAMAARAFSAVHEGVAFGV